MTTGLPQYGQAGTVGRRLAAKAAIGFRCDDFGSQAVGRSRRLLPSGNPDCSDPTS